MGLIDTIFHIFFLLYYLFNYSSTYFQIKFPEVFCFLLQQLVIPTLLIPVAFEASVGELNFRIISLVSLFI